MTKFLDEYKPLVEVEPEHYRSAEGHHIRREDEGLSPGGNRFGGCWVLRDRDFKYIDHDQFRHDLMERHGFNTTTKTLKQFLREALA